MARLPVPGSDDGNWGDILNDFLRQVHTEDGKLKTNTVTAAHLSPGSVTTIAIGDSTVSESKLAQGVKDKLNALASVTGGREVELRTNPSHIQWRYVGDNTWTDLVALTDLQGSAGAKGDKGDTGETGPAGPQGDSGVDGDSAYELAVAQGFVGTEVEWLASLEGPEGPPGTTTWAGITDKPTEFPPTGHDHDDRYYTEAEVDAALAGKASSTHNHDGTYASASHDHDGTYATAAQGAKADDAIPSSLVDAKGDLIVGIADNTVGRLAGGADGHVLTRDSAQATGVKWAEPPAGGGGADVSLAGSFWARPLGMVSGFSTAVYIGTNVANSMSSIRLLDYDIGDPGSIKKVALSVWTAHDEPGGGLVMYAYYKTSALSYQRIGLIGQVDCSTTGTKIVTLESPFAVPGKFTLAFKCVNLTGTANPAFAGTTQLIATALPDHGIAGNNSSNNSRPFYPSWDFPETFTSNIGDGKGLVIALEVEHP